MHKHFSSLHYEGNLLLPARSDFKKHDTAWLDINCFSVILSKVWAYPINFTTNNNTNKLSLRSEIFYLFIFCSPTIPLLTTLCSDPQNHGHLQNLDYKFSKIWSLWCTHLDGSQVESSFSAKPRPLLFFPQDGRAQLHKGELPYLPEAQTHAASEGSWSYMHIAMHIHVRHVYTSKKPEGTRSASLPHIPKYSSSI